MSGQNVGLWYKRKAKLKEAMANFWILNFYQCLVGRHVPCLRGILNVPKVTSLEAIKLTTYIEVALFATWEQSQSKFGRGPVRMESTKC